MITNKDIQKLSQVLATKEDVKEIYARLDNVESIVSAHTVILDGLTKNVATTK
jgi:hypothetical protein